MPRIVINTPFADNLRSSLTEAGELVEVINKANGWYDNDRSFGDDIALLHSEVSEMLEAYRENGTKDVTNSLPQTNKGDTTLPKPEGVGSEAADVLVRLLDTCVRYKIDLADEFLRKTNYNVTRAHRHGGKLL